MTRIRIAVTVLLTFLLTLAPSAARAGAEPPAKPHEVFFGIGDAGMLWEFEDVFISMFSLGYISYGDEKLGFQVVGGYQRHLNDWASLGATASWAGSQRAMYFGNDYVGDVERRMYSVLFDTRARWVRRPGWQMYSGLGFGVVALTDEDEYGDESTSGAGWHLIPIGVRIGRDVAAFGEFGVGWHGFLKGGITRRW